MNVGIMGEPEEIPTVFLPDRDLLTAFAGRNIQFGIQTRIAPWKPEMLDLLGEAGCVSVEAGVESIFAWERAHEHYLRPYSQCSDVQDNRPLPLPEPETVA